MTAPAGWYPTEQGQRWWDGEQWTTKAANPPPKVPQRRKMTLGRKITIAGLIIALVGIGLSGLAKLLSGSTTDGKFASTTAPLLPGTSASERKTLGHDVCSNLDNGGTVTSIALNMNASQGISLSDAATFIGDSVAAYCPDNRSLLTP